MWITKVVCSTNSRSPEAEDVKGEPVAKKTEMVNYTISMYILIFIVIVSNVLYLYSETHVYSNNTKLPCIFQN